MLPSRRLQSLRFLATSVRPGDVALCREVEAACHALARTADDYDDHIRRAGFNLHENPSVGIEVVHAADASLTEGTLLGRIQAESDARQLRFQQMLQEKYDALDDRKFQAIVRCRRCGGSDVNFMDKQTRSADEAATVFCVCATCKLRWTMR